MVTDDRIRRIVDVKFYLHVQTNSVVSVVMFEHCLLALLQNAVYKDDKVIAQPPLLPLSSAHIDRHGAYLMDTGSQMYLWLGAAISDQFCHDVIGVPNFQAVTDGKVSFRLLL